MKAFSRGGQVRMLVDWATQHGWSVEQTNGDHLRFTHPKAGVVFSSFTPSCPRAFYNARAKMRRSMKAAGFLKEDVR